MVLLRVKVNCFTRLWMPTQGDGGEKTRIISEKSQPPQGTFTTLQRLRFGAVSTPLKRNPWSLMVSVHVKANHSSLILFGATHQPTCSPNTLPVAQTLSYLLNHDCATKDILVCISWNVFLTKGLLCNGKVNYTVSCPCGPSVHNRTEEKHTDEANNTSLL